jgi:hypothetical protein
MVATVAQFMAGLPCQASWARSSKAWSVRRAYQCQAISDALLLGLGLLAVARKDGGWSWRL